MTDPEEYAEAVLQLVEAVPPGQVTTYGEVAAVLQQRLAVGGPRTVARVMAAYGAGVPWWRCVRADGTLPDRLADEARQRWLSEGTPLRASGAVDLGRAVGGL